MRDTALVPERGNLCYKAQKTARGDEKDQPAAGESSKGQELWELLEQQ